MVRQQERWGRRRNRNAEQPTNKYLFNLRGVRCELRCRRGCRSAAPSAGRAAGRLRWRRVRPECPASMEIASQMESEAAALRALSAAALACAMTSSTRFSASAWLVPVCDATSCAVRAVGARKRAAIGGAVGEDRGGLAVGVRHAAAGIRAAAGRAGRRCGAGGRSRRSRRSPRRAKAGRQYRRRRCRFAAPAAAPAPELAPVATPPPERWRPRRETAAPRMVATAQARKPWRCRGTGLRNYTSRSIWCAAGRRYIRRWSRKSSP